MIFGTNVFIESIIISAIPAMIPTLIAQATNGVKFEVKSKLSILAPLLVLHEK